MSSPPALQRGATSRPLSHSTLGPAQHSGLVRLRPDQAAAASSHLWLAESNWEGAGCQHQRELSGGTRCRPNGGSRFVCGACHSDGTDCVRSAGVATAGRNGGRRRPGRTGYRVWLRGS